MQSMKIYGKENCIWCEKAISLAEEHHIPYTYKKIEDLEVRDTLLKLLPDVKTVPQIWFDGKHVGGYEDLKELLDGRYSSS